MRNYSWALPMAPAFLLASVQAQSSGYTFERVDAPNAIYTYVNSINNHGTIIGNWGNGSEHHDFIARNGEFEILEIAIEGAQSTTLADLNDREDIVGTYQDANFQTHGFLRRANGQLTILQGPSPNATGLQPNAINNRGDIVGNWGDANGFSHPFVYRRGSFEDIQLSIAGASAVVPADINNRGTILGSYQTEDGRAHFFIHENGRDTTFEEPNTNNAAVYGINDSGLIVGTATTLGQDTQMPKSHAFVYDRGVFTDLVPAFPEIPSQSIFYSAAIDVTNDGVILGQSHRTKDAIVISFLATAADCD
jgi:probable HAF family extracellular repeat protein